MRITPSTAGRSHRVSRAGKGTSRSSSGKKVGQKTLMKAKKQVHAESEQESKEIEVVFHAPVDVTAAEAVKIRMRSLPVVSEAKKILITAGYIPARLSEPMMPVNLIGLGGRAGTLLVYAVRLKVPVPSAAKLRELCTSRVDQLRVLAGKVIHRVMIFVDSPVCGWRYYLIYPGGLRYDHDFATALK